MQAVFGSTNLVNDTENQVIIRFDKLFIHPDFEMTGKDAKNDIALLRSKTNILANKNVKKILLPKFDQDFHGSGKLTGYGYLNLTEHNYVQLNWVCLNLVPGQLCRQYGQFIDGMHLCLGNTDPHKQPCVGDNGSPFIVRNEDDQRVVAGLVSYGYNSNCGNERFNPQYTVMTKVSHYVPWILDTVFNNR